nr:ARM repeat superfamily protein [Tanacetum cinerariifolium]
MIESWQSWYKRSNSGKLVRQASTDVCILNEMVFGLSDQAIDNTKKHSNVVIGDINFHFFHDNAMLHQVMIDGIGIFNLSLESDFVSSGFQDL